MLCALIMAGGKGTRFYPASTEKKPKQFLNLVGSNTMIQDTVKRIEPIISIDKVFVATCAEYVDLVKEQLPDLPVDNIIVEPVGRNTAPCVVLSAIQMNNKFKDATMLVLPSDSLIQDCDEYNSVVSDGYEFIEENPKTVVTIGIQPTRPEIGYGYIKTTDSSIFVGKHNVIKVDCFVEKPNLETAQKYLLEEKYFWNAGMFMWKVEYVLHLAKVYMNETYNKLLTIGDIKSPDYKDKLFSIYPQVEKISVDYALMEKVDTIHVIRGDFGWDDLGSWNALDRYLPKDNTNNSFKGDLIAYQSNGNTAFSNNKTIRFLGVNDLFCIETDDEIVVGKKSLLPEIHELCKLDKNK